MNPPPIAQLGFLCYASVISTILLPRYLQLRTRISLHQQAQEQTKRQNQRKDQFFSLLANDLKTPLVNLGAYFELLLRHTQQLPELQRKELLLQANRAARQLHHMLENLLAWARNEMTPIPFQPRPLLVQDLVQRQTDQLDPLAQHKKIRLHTQLQAGAEVMADPYMVDFVLHNLLHNAIRHTPAGKQITISTYQRDQQLWVEVEDQGAGIPPHVLQQLAQYHKQPMPLQDTGKGTGLGLLMSKHFLRLHQSELQVDNRLSGCMCSFFLPLYQTSQKENKEPENQQNKHNSLVN